MSKFYARRSEKLLLAVALMVMSSWGPAAASSLEPLLAWNPGEATGENWRGGEVRDLPAITVTPTRQCSHTERAWVSNDSPTRLALAWQECPDDAVAVLASSLDAYVDGQQLWPDVQPVLPNDADRVWQTANGHVRQWTHGDKIVYLELECQALPRSACTDLSGGLARDLSGGLPGTPGLQSDWMGWLRQVFVWALPLWLLGIWFVGFVRRRRSPKHTFLLHDRWWDVVRGAQTLKRKAFARKLFIALLCFLAMIAVEIVRRDLSSQAGLKTLLQVIFWTLLLLPALIMLRNSGDPLIKSDWLWRSRSSRPPVGARMRVAVLMVVSVVPIPLLVITWTNLAYYDWYEIALTNAERAVGALLITFSFVIGTFSARRANRIRISSGLSLLNSSAGLPFGVVADSGVRMSRIRSTGFSRRGVLLSIFDSFTGRPLASFSNFITLLVARHGRVDAAESSLNRAVVLFASDHLAEATEVGKSPESARVLVVVPPMNEREFARFQRSVAEHPVFHPLSLPWASSASQVFAHVPGEGWFAWGASVRSEWTYVRAMEDAMAFAVPRWDLVLAQQGARTGDLASRSAVALVASGSDSAVAAEVTVLLGELGFTMSEVEDDVPVVVLLSLMAVEDETWRAAVDELHGRDARLIPLRCGEPVDAKVTPDGVRDVNWMQWPGSSPADLFTAICSSPAVYRLHRDLVEQAKRWHNQGRPNHLLISGREHAEAMARALDQSEYDLLAKPDHQARTYVNASLSRLTGTRRAFLRGAIGLITACAVVVVTVAGVITAARTAVHSNNIGVVSSQHKSFLADNPDYVGLQSAALMLQGDEEQRAVGRAALRAVLDQPWPLSRLGSEHDSYFSDISIPTREYAFTLDQVGSLTKWSVSTAKAEWRHFVADDASALDVRADGKLVAVAAGNKLHLIQPEPWRDVVVDLGTKVRKLAHMPASGSVAVVTTGGVLWSVQVDAPNAIRQIGKFDDANMLRSTVEGEARLLLVGPEHGVRLLDAATGAQVGAVPMDVPMLNRSAAIGPDGVTIAVVDAGRRLHVGSLDDLRPTGQEVPFDLIDLQVASAEVVLYASAQFGIQVFDRLSGMTTMAFSDPVGTMQSVVVSPDGRTMATYGKNLVAIWSSGGITSLTGPGPVRNSSTATTRSANGLHAVGNTDGTVSIPERGIVIPAVRGAVTALAIGDDGRTVVVGSSRGEVAVVDARPGVLVRRWQAPDGSPVAEVGWGPLAESLVVRTAPNRWWSPLSCNGCGSDEALIDQLKSRLQPCYRENNVRDITEEVRTRLGIELCVKSPKPERS